MKIKCQPQRIAHTVKLKASNNKANNNKKRKKNYALQKLRNGKGECLMRMYIHTNDTKESCAQNYTAAYVRIIFHLSVLE